MWGRCPAECLFLLSAQAVLASQFQAVPRPNGSSFRGTCPKRSASKIAADFQTAFGCRFALYLQPALLPTRVLPSLFPPESREAGLYLKTSLDGITSSDWKFCAYEFAEKREFRRIFESFRSFPAFVLPISGNGVLAIPADSLKIMNWRKSASSAANSRSPDFVFETEI